MPAAREKRKISMRSRLILCILIVALLVSAMCPPAFAAGGTKQSKSRAIAIVFDNSGSMYMGLNEAWCRATYAIEVFASMMNKGDILQVYPMYEVEVDGRSYTSEEPFTIYGGDDTSVIRTMYSPRPGDTPIETITDAYNGLKKIKADEQWLIVLTDGTDFYENLISLGSRTQSRLEEVLAPYNEEVNVMFLSIGTNAAMPNLTTQSEYKYHAAKASDSKDTLTKLTEMCNIIFGRDVLPDTGSSINFDVSMRKLILFVQGTEISNVDIKDASGKSIGKPSLSYSPRYGERGAGGGYTIQVDRSLSGYIAVYDQYLDAGTYTVEYSGEVSSVKTYYEPDVDLTVVLTDSYGMVVDPSGELYPGTYTINYGLVDRHGEATQSALLGDTNYRITYTVNGVEQTVVSASYGQIPIELGKGDVLDANITVTYLGGYTINKSSADFNWPRGGLVVLERPAGFLELKITGNSKTVNLSELEQTSYDVTLIYDGVPVTGEQLARAELSVAVEEGNVGTEILRGENGYTLQLKHAGAAADTICGEYTIYVKAAYTDEFETRCESNVVALSMELLDDSYGLEMDLDGDSYYIISKLDSAEAIMVRLSLDGQPLTDEQLAAVQLEIDGDGLNLESQPLMGESALAAKIVRDNSAKKGRYDLSFTATSKDQVGRPISAEDSMDVELSPYPQWLRILVISLILLLLLLLIWLYLNAKILPKKIMVGSSQTTFIVNGDNVNGAAKCNYSGGGKRAGSIQVTTPNYSGNPLVKGGFSLNLTAVSPRRVKSSRRRALVTGISVSNSTALQSLSIGPHSLTKVDEGDSISWIFDGKQVPSSNVATKFELGGKPSCTFVGETITGESFTMTVQMIFK